MRRSWHLVLLLSLALGACTASPTIQVPEADHVLVPVFYATDRATDRDRSATTSSVVPYGNGRGSLSYGRLEVSIPRSHIAGQLEEPSWWRFESAPDPGKYILLRSVTVLQDAEFHDRLQGRIAAAPGQDAFVFVHGFNVGFSEAARRTAQLAYDLGFEGVPILYSWPSQADATLYSVDSTNADWTAWHFEEFLKGLAARAGASRIHIISHSLGGKVVVAALESIARTLNGNDAPPFGQVILCAPDVDRDIFRRAAPGLLEAARRLTLYASSNDQALNVSKQFNGYTRAGDLSDGGEVPTGIDLIDASDADTSLLGHSYYGESLMLLSDMSRIIEAGLPPERRPGLRADRTASGAIWRFGL